jgi:hypothetical protein
MLREAIWRNRAKECLDKIEPLDSLAFDVSVARHALEEGECERAKRWLDIYHATGELRKSFEHGLLTKEEAAEISHMIKTILENIEKDSITALEEIIKLQEICVINAYVAFTKCVTLGIKS